MLARHERRVIRLLLGLTSDLSLVAIKSMLELRYQVLRRRWPLSRYWLRRRHPCLMKGRVLILLPRMIARVNGRRHATMLVHQRRHSIRILHMLSWVASVWSKLIVERRRQCLTRWRLRGVCRHVAAISHALHGEVRVAVVGTTRRHASSIRLVTGLRCCVVMAALVLLADAIWLVPVLLKLLLSHLGAQLVQLLLELTQLLHHRVSLVVRWLLLLRLERITSLWMRPDWWRTTGRILLVRLISLLHRRLSLVLILGLCQRNGGTVVWQLRLCLRTPVQVVGR